MKGLLLILLPCAALGTAPLEDSNTQSARVLAKELSGHVVRIKTYYQNPDLGTVAEVGFGFVVGWNRDSICFVTSGHVWSNSEVLSDTTIRKVWSVIQYPEWEGNSIRWTRNDTLEPGTIRAERDEELDLQAVHAGRRESQALRKGAFGDDYDLRRDQAVFFIGVDRRHDGIWSETFLAHEEDSFRMTHVNFRRGSSGAPVFSSTGFVGIGTEGDSKQTIGRVVRSRVIKEFVKSKRMLWNLETSPFVGNEEADEFFSGVSAARNKITLAFDFSAMAHPAAVGNQALNAWYHRLVTPRMGSLWFPVRYLYLGAGLGATRMTYARRVIGNETGAEIVDTMRFYSFVFDSEWYPVILQSPPFLLRTRQSLRVHKLNPVSSPRFALAPEFGLGAEVRFGNGFSLNLDGILMNSPMTVQDQVLNLYGKATEKEVSVDWIRSLRFAVSGHL